jgi:hypothetical protein
MIPPNCKEENLVCQASLTLWQVRCPCLAQSLPQLLLVIVRKRHKDISVSNNVRDSLLYMFRMLVWIPQALVRFHGSVWNFISSFSTYLVLKSPLITTCGIERKSPPTEDCWLEHHISSPCTHNIHEHNMIIWYIICTNHWYYVDSLYDQDISRPFKTYRVCAALTTSPFSGLTKHKCHDN